ncbi:MAG TPA: peptidoglycan recognition family protein [Bryobacteraceae bacterium]|nr:peptidoglycan recognition family protein [Bryobacteraceae bacterium]
MTPEWVGCAEGNFRRGRSASWQPEAIVIHISVGSLASADAWFHNPAARVSAHYLVAKSGAIHQYVNEEDTAYHAGVPVKPIWKLLRPGVNPNSYTIGIEHEGQPEDVWPEEQYQASAELVADIAQRWSIPVDEDHIVLHREIRANKSCPGFVFNRATLLAKIAALSVPPADPPSGEIPT